MYPTDGIISAGVPNGGLIWLNNFDCFKFCQKCEGKWSLATSNAQKKQCYEKPHAEDVGFETIKYAYENLSLKYFEN